MSQLDIKENLISLHFNPTTGSQDIMQQPRKYDSDVDATGSAPKSMSLFPIDGGT